MFILLRIIAVILIVVPLLLTSREQELTVKKKLLYASVSIIGLILFIAGIFIR